MGYSEHSEAPKSMIDALKNKTTATNFVQVIPDSHFWTDLNQIITANNIDIEELTKEYIIVGLTNTKKNGYKLKPLFNEDIRFIQGSIPIFSSIDIMIDYVKSEEFNIKLFLDIIQQTINTGINLTNGLKSNRQEIYNRIDGERKYQDEKWGTRRNANGTPDEEKPISEWLNYIEYHLSKAKERVYHLDDEGALNEIRKVTTLGVRAMEIHGCPERIVKLDHNPDSCCGKCNDGCCGVYENNE